MFVLGENHFRKCFSVNAGVWLRMENKFSGNAFQLTVCWGVKWFPFLFYLQISFSGKQRESWVRVRSCPRAEREREREKRPNPETDSDEPRNRIQRTQKTQDRACSSSNAQTHSSNPENSFDRTISDPHCADRTTGKIVAPQHRSTQNWSFSSHPNPASSSSTQIRHRRPRFIVPIHRTQSPLSLSLSIWPDLMNFFCWDLFFCVYLLRNDINICLEDEKMWEIW